MAKKNSTYWFFINVVFLKISIGYPMVDFSKPKLATSTTLYFRPSGWASPYLAWVFFSFLTLATEYKCNLIQRLKSNIKLFTYNKIQHTRFSLITLHLHKIRKGLYLYHLLILQNLQIKDIYKDNINLYPHNP